MHKFYWILCFKFFCSEKTKGIEGPCGSPVPTSREIIFLMKRIMDLAKAMWCLCVRLSSDFGVVCSLVVLVLA